jgi:hypothetical protein
MPQPESDHNQRTEGRNCGDSQIDLVELIPVVRFTVWAVVLDFLCWILTKPPTLISHQPHIASPRRQHVATLGGLFDYILQCGLLNFCCGHVSVIIVILGGMLQIMTPSGVSCIIADKYIYQSCKHGNTCTRCPLRHFTDRTPPYLPITSASTNLHTKTAPNPPQSPRWLKLAVNLALFLL